MSIKVWIIDKKSEKYKKSILKKARLVASFLHLNGVIEVFLVGDRQMKKNVLSFVAEETRGKFVYPNSKEKYLGEIYLNPSYIKKNDENIIFMLFHGLLHIAGYDHKRKNDRIKMERKEEIIFSKFGK
jgi:rRNA maturation RNase YbeY